MNNSIFIKTIVYLSFYKNSNVSPQILDELEKKYYNVFATAPGGLTVGAIIQAGKTKLIIHPEPLFNDEDENFLKILLENF